MFLLWNAYRVHAHFTAWRGAEALRTALATPAEAAAAVATTAVHELTAVSVHVSTSSTHWPTAVWGWRQRREAAAALLRSAEMAALLRAQELAALNAELGTDLLAFFRRVRIAAPTQAPPSRPTEPPSAQQAQPAEQPPAPNPPGTQRPQ